MHSLEQLRSGALAGIRHLKLSGGLTEFPTEIFSLADTLEVLDLSGNRLTSLPENLPSLGKLRVLFCSDNQFTVLPKVLGACPRLSMVGFKANQIQTVPAESLPAKLRWLILTDNRIEVLPPELGLCDQLQKLMLAGNRLRVLPLTLASCTRLELLRIAANQLKELPDWLLNMPRLSWLAYAGNPLAHSLEAQALNNTPVDIVTWSQLTLRCKLGEGASGIIHRADLRISDDDCRPVAVKLFKGVVTSDGLPECEMAACISAGNHPNLIPVLGKVAGHPDAAHGLVMPLIDGQFANLAGPPSLESCTRDVYSPETSFAPEAVLSMARSVASVACHLHARGIMHGDLYGHNILHCGQGRVVVGDFGAASFYPFKDASCAVSLERLEVRAFGCLLEELVGRINQDLRSTVLLVQLTTLIAACLCEIPAKRPLFAEIEQELAAISSSDYRQLLR